MLECLARAAAQPQGAQRLASFSAEIIAPANTKSGAEFLTAVHRLTANPLLGFLTIGGSGPLAENNHVQKLLAQWPNEAQWRRVPLVMNVMCRNMDAGALAKTVLAARGCGAALCVLRGNPSIPGRSAVEDDAFRYPSDLLRHLSSTEAPPFQLAAGGSPSDDRAAADEDWRYVSEKIRAGARAIFPTPMLQHDRHTLAHWLKDAPHRLLMEQQQQQQRAREGDAAAASSLPHPTAYAVPCVLASVAPKLLNRIVTARHWPVPSDLDGPLRVGLLPPHPNSSIDEDVWAANTARVFKRIMTEYTAQHLRAILDDAVAGGAGLNQGNGEEARGGVVVPRHVHIVTYENNADDVLSLVQAVQQQQQTGK